MGYAAAAKGGREGQRLANGVTFIDKKIKNDKSGGGHD